MINDDVLLDGLKELDVRNLLWKYLEAKTGKNQILELVSPKAIRNAESAIEDLLKLALEK